MMLAVLEIYNEEIETNKQTYADEEKDNLEPPTTMNRANNNGGNDRDNEMDENIRNSALKLLEQISKDER
jgi:hypothetical protein